MTHFFRALDSYDGPVPVRRGDILRADVRQPVDAAALLPPGLALELLDGPPSAETPILTLTADTFPAVALDASRGGGVVH